MTKRTLESLIGPLLSYQNHLLHNGQSHGSLFHNCVAQAQQNLTSTNSSAVALHSMANFNSVPILTGNPLLISSSHGTGVLSGVETLVKRARFDSNCSASRQQEQHQINYSISRNALDINSKLCQSYQQKQRMSLKSFYSNDCPSSDSSTSHDNTADQQSTSAALPTDNNGHLIINGAANSNHNNNSGLFTDGTSQKNSSKNNSSTELPISRVVHLRNIPSDMTELELVHFCMPFGQLANYLMLKGKNQAFVEYIDEQSAKSIVEVAEACPMTIRLRTIFCQYSTYRELKTIRKPAAKEGSLLGPGRGLVGSILSTEHNDANVSTTTILAQSALGDATIAAVATPSRPKPQPPTHFVAGQKRAHSQESSAQPASLPYIITPYVTNLIQQQITPSPAVGSAPSIDATAAALAAAQQQQQQQLNQQQQHQQLYAAALYNGINNISNSVYGTLALPQAGTVGVPSAVDASTLSKRSRLSFVSQPTVSAALYTPAGGLGGPSTAPGIVAGANGVSAANFFSAASYFAIQQQQQQQQQQAAVIAAAAAAAANAQKQQQQQQPMLLRTHLNTGAQKQKQCEPASSLRFMSSADNAVSRPFRSSRTAGSAQKNGKNSPNTTDGGEFAIRNGSASASQLDISGSGTQQQPNTVLRVIIDNMLYAITLDVLYTIFSRYGKVLRIITFNKNNTFQALIQMSEASAAQNARHSLDGQNVYNGCCTLRIDYSKLATLNIKYNNDKSRDYTNPTLPAGEISFEQQLSLVTAAASQNQLNNQINSIMPHGAFATFPLTSAANNFFQPQQTLLSNSDVINSAANAAAAAAAVAAVNSSTGTHSASNISPFFNFGAANNFAAAAAAAAAAANGAGNPQGASAALNFPQLANLIGSPVILVSNLDENKITPDALFTLFGVYGDVHRVKILFNRKNSALIQFAEPQQAYLATQHLDKVKWHDKVIRITPSKHTNVQMPKEGQPDSGLTRDYINSPLHRFKKPGSKNYMNIYAPSSTLHLSNIPPSITEEFLTNAFEEKGFPVKMLKFFQNDHKMALVQLESVDQAISALTQMHNYKLADNAHLRVSFSKKGLSAEAH